MSKAWSKATAAQRANHRKRCQEAGELRRKQNFVWRICDQAGKAGIDGLEFLTLYCLLDENKKFPLEDSQNERFGDLLRKKMRAEEIYQEMFGC